MAWICEQIISALDIAEVIGERVMLRPASRGYSGLCPFHEEGTPSFHVYEDTQSYYCFGCHEAGNVITYVMKTENVAFPEALRILANRAGITLSENRQDVKNAKEVLNLAARFYAYSLSKSAAARAYLERRKLDDTDIARFSLGYAPAAWDKLASYLHSHHVGNEQMRELGLAKPCRYGMYDKFRGRLIIPVKDIAGHLIGFGGRLIEGDGAEYISEIASGRRHLYLLDRAYRAIREKKRTILASGYMDAIQLHKKGFAESVSPLGASLTSEQLEMLSRLSKVCYIGSELMKQKTFLEGMYAMQKAGMSIYVINLPEEYLSEHSADEIEDGVQEARPLIEQHIYTPGVPKRELWKELYELESYEVLWYKRQLSEVTGLSPSEVERSVLSKRLVPEKRIAPSKKPEAELEAGICALLLHNAECRLKLTAEEVQKEFKDEPARITALSILSEVWSRLCEPEKQEVLKRGEDYCASLKLESEEEKWDMIYTELKERNRLERLREIEAKMKMSEATEEELYEFARLKRGIPCES